MFKIVPVQNIEDAKKYADICGISLIPGAFIYSMIDIQSGNLMALSQFEILGEEGYIYNIKSVPVIDDFEAMFILTRQTMNFIDICGAHKCKASKDAADDTLMRATGFKLIDDAYKCDMDGMFDGSHCSGHDK
jgi:hypothetical protein